MPRLEPSPLRQRKRRGEHSVSFDYLLTPSRAARLLQNDADGVKPNIGEFGSNSGKRRTGLLSANPTARNFC
jgi:hypothetical protein